eukprot:1382664-Rhodomonas_salina.1
MLSVYNRAHIPPPLHILCIVIADGYVHRRMCPCICDTLTAIDGVHKSIFLHIGNTLIFYVHVRKRMRPHIVCILIEFDCVHRLVSRHILYTLSGFDCVRIVLCLHMAYTSNGFGQVAGVGLGMIHGKDVGGDVGMSVFSLWMLDSDGGSFG